MNTAIWRKYQFITRPLVANALGTSDVSSVGSMPSLMVGLSASTDALACVTSENWSGQMGNTAAQDYDDITKAIQPYLDGAKAGKGDAMKPAFHANATVYGYLGDTLVSGPIKLIYDWADSIGPAPKVKPRVVKVDVAGTAANVRVEVDNWQQHRFTDVFNLLKIDGKWVIVNKIFHTHQ